MIRFYGQPATDLDVDMRTKTGTFLAHWPTGEGLPNRLRWAGMPAVELVDRVEDSELAFVDADHWILAAREVPALFVRRGSRAERFLAYDTELNLPAPIKLQGGPDTFTVVNTSDAPVYDVLVSRPTREGRRVAWIDVLPPRAATAKPAAGGDKPKPDLFVTADPAKPAAPAAPQNAAPQNAAPQSPPPATEAAGAAAGEKKAAQKAKVAKPSDTPKTADKTAAHWLVLARPGMTRQHACFAKLTS